MTLQECEAKVHELGLDAMCGSQTLPMGVTWVGAILSILASIAAGQPVMVIPDHAELTTQQAADLMNVSRPHVIKLLDEGKIQYRLVGTHRRVEAASVKDYISQARARQRAAADQLSELTEEMGLY